MLPFKIVRRGCCHVVSLNTSYAQVTPEPALILTSGSQGRSLCLSDKQSILKLADTKKSFLRINDYSLGEKNFKTVFLIYSTSF